jgi:hypothetical protein
MAGKAKTKTVDKVVLMVSGAVTSKQLDDAA